MDHDAIYKALASPVRREILRTLRSPEPSAHPLASGATGLSVNEISELFSLRQSSASAHLAVLAEVDFVTVQAVSQFRFYRRNEKSIQRFLAEASETL